RDMGYAVVVEGYMDFISLYQAGIKNVVATLGTAFTDRQVGLIKRYTDRIVLFYDSDEAGINAAKRSFVPLLENDLKVDAMFLEDEMDPDEAVRKLGHDELERRLKKAKPLMEKMISDEFSKEYRISEMAGITNKILGYIALIHSNSLRTMWLKELSIRSGIEIRKLNESLVRTKKQEQPSNIIRLANQVKNSPQHKLYEQLLRVLFLIPQLSERVFDEEWDEYIPEDLRNFISKVKNLMGQRGELTVSDWLYISKETGFDWFENFLTKEFINKKNNDGMNLEREFTGCMVKFKMQYLERKRIESSKKIKEGENAENTLREYEAIVKEINRLKPMLGVLE
ncbi:MAG: toprim domain-containing protein, partial [Proteobacteria bacterium]|nr:toprim domain-containing protein [Pseudomonadota bacterium]